jgi:predicted cupin superfamily sugar epimerase
MPLDPLSRLAATGVIRLLDLEPHPEGGHFRETFRDSARDGSGRAVSTSIYFLLQAGEVSRWHRIDTAEVWHYYCGAPLELRALETDAEIGMHRLGPHLL